MPPTAATPSTVSVPSRAGPIDFRPALRLVAELIKKATYENFDNSHDPRGNRWEPITDYTWEHRVENTYNRGPLVDTKELYDATEEGCDNPAILEYHHLGIGTPSDHAARHQFGGESESGRPVPRRQYRGWNRQMIEETKRIVAAHAAAALRARGRA
jgi:phage gpG-like protein